MDRQNNIKAAIKIWGPIKSSIDNRTRELWGEISPEFIRKTIMSYKGHKIIEGDVEGKECA